MEERTAVRLRALIARLRAENFALRKLVVVHNETEAAIVTGKDPGVDIELFAGLELRRREALEALAEVESP